MTFDDLIMNPSFVSSVFFVIISTYCKSVFFWFLLGMGWARSQITPFFWREVHPFELGNRRCELRITAPSNRTIGNCLSRWWLLKDLLFSPRTLGKIPMLTNMFQVGWFNHQPVYEEVPANRFFVGCFR